MAVAHNLKTSGDAGRGAGSARRSNFLTKTGRGLIAAPMINAVTISAARRRRIIAVWADVCV
jgi:hypothetical protein